LFQETLKDHYVFSLYFQFKKEKLMNLNISKFQHPKPYLSLNISASSNKYNWDDLVKVSLLVENETIK